MSLRYLAPKILSFFLSSNTAIRLSGESSAMRVRYSSLLPCLRILDNDSRSRPRTKSLSQRNSWNEPASILRAISSTLESSIAWTVIPWL
ncbi:hypothetical protein OGAPHI_005754 [Ogataea philodendri]|uniref:Uncharacterized protein n=1 Tax=Ogataea philodendri TaxID=1378263 RepID=A0A9P8P0C0_9ASCO|nr:uncharacterized protein OGAPHI_005754 [Ogataea philodendri]KAH3662502.1 hypothetical protein OGAPHI_005754 [Ogataea philodendri]